jgi:hypothetical protein
MQTEPEAGPTVARAVGDNKREWRQRPCNTNRGPRCVHRGGSRPRNGNGFHENGGDGHNDRFISPARYRVGVRVLMPGV